MNFVAQLEDYLRDLGAEARKKHPGMYCTTRNEYMHVGFYLYGIC